MGLAQVPTEQSRNKAMAAAYRDGGRVRPMTWLGVPLAQRVNLLQGRLFGPDRYHSTGKSPDWMRFGKDSDGNRWTTSRWRDTTVTTVKPLSDPH